MLSREADLRSFPVKYCRIFPFAFVLVFAFAVAPLAAQTTSTSPVTTATDAASAPQGDKPALITPTAGEPAAKPQPPAASTAPPASKSGLASSLLPHDLSPFGMFMAADMVVKGVMIGLACASFATWTILLAKTIELFGARNRATRALSALADAKTLREAAELTLPARTPVARLIAAALAEADRSHDLPPEGIKDRAATLLSRIEARAGRAMGRGTGVLATIGSTAPLVGLFGTVWGIMNSFIGISRTNTTNLAVVAPGIAEALLATACGLVAAIPAVIIYNLFARGITGYRAVLGDASAEVMRLLSRDLDRAQAAPVARRQAAE